MSKLKAWFNRPRRLIALLFIQIWVWPQFFANALPPNIFIPLLFTAGGCFIANIIHIMISFDRGEHLE